MTPMEYNKGMKKVGTVTHYYGKLGVAILQLEASLKVGDTVKFQGHGADFEQSVSSLQVDHAEVSEAAAGSQVGMKTDQPVREGSEVFLA
jgi:putative protease